MRNLTRFVRMLSGCLFLTIAAALPVGAAQPDHAGSLSLEQLMATLRTVQHVDASYIERRTLRALRTPIETHGTLRFDAPDQLEETTDAAGQGMAKRLRISGNRLTIDRGPNAAPVVLMLNEHPEIEVLIESIRATLAGDGATLRRTFDISLAGAVDHWQLVLQPHNPAQRGVLQWTRITGYGNRIAAVETQEGDGDHAEMTIQDRTP